MKPLRWGLLGAAKFALQHMGPAIHAAQGATLAAMATSSPTKAAAFRASVANIKVYESYDDLLAATDIDAVYIPLPNHLHVDWTLKALDAGKHVLCEKPMTLMASEFDRLISARDASGLLVAEAFMIVHHPQWLRAREIVASGILGRLRHVAATFSFYNDDMTNIRNIASAGGGGLRDIGIYAFGSTRFVTGQEPHKITHAKVDYENGVDVFAQVAADFDDFDYCATISMRMFPRQEVVIHGEKGVLKLSCPFNPTVHAQAELHLEVDAHTITTERFPSSNHYILQVEAFGRSVTDGSPYACPLEFSKGTQQMIDMVFAKLT